MLWRTLGCVRLVYNKALAQNPLTLHGSKLWAFWRSAPI
ncbi:helix-turn-helix domain-containing protein [Lyngbya sp. CCY1209]|nr:helix-turn-helix domain-containing protein [Lyngbya sp. CCY1209]MEB3883298.1 helix-turn-helix domain-containing protein [Lyngbya sp. CCY1209]